MTADLSSKYNVSTKLHCDIKLRKRARQKLNFLSLLILTRGREIFKYAKIEIRSEEPPNTT